ncbi:hypothetical protein BaRGS_00010892 [Batillaria attramentaria]|uniref:Uncharacterized protein n=1 Tax=Batillaria attramentaria TaxID=370345 RepID=A0ABD0LEU0_9CAEN
MTQLDRFQYQGVWRHEQQFTRQSSVHQAKLSSPGKAQFTRQSTVHQAKLSSPGKAQFTRQSSVHNDALIIHDLLATFLTEIPTKGGGGGGSFLFFCFLGGGGSNLLTRTVDLWEE